MTGGIADRIAAVAERISAVLGPGMMPFVARLNKRVTNPIQRLWASNLSHMAVIEHTGRKSGYNYQTPVMAFVEDSGLSVVLNYGEKSDWVRNVQSAGSAVVVHQGKRYKLTDPRIVSSDSPDLPAGVRAIGDSARKALHGTLNPA